jgi:hypothetical protein
MEDGRRIFLGLARLSVSTGWWIIPIPTEGHHPDRERDALLRELVQAGAVESYNKFRVVPPVSMKTFTGQLFQTDGYMYMIELK